MSRGWIGVDLDGTLAMFDGESPPDVVGQPIYPMVQRVKHWLARGHEVRIVTARADGGEAAASQGNPLAEAYRDVDRVIGHIQDWTAQHVGARLPVTNKKDYGMIELWDDRAVRVVHNQGYPCCIPGLSHLTSTAAYLHQIATLVRTLQLMLFEISSRMQHEQNEPGRQACSAADAQLSGVTAALRELLDEYTNGLKTRTA